MDNKLIRSIKDMRRQKQIYRDCIRRAKQLPEDFEVVYKVASSYMLNFSTSEPGVLNLLPDMLDLLETAAIDGRDVLEVVGNDVMAFCDDMLEGISAETWTGKMRAKMNASVHKKLGR